MNSVIYLDYAATAPAEPAALDAARDCALACYANPSAVYAAAAEARRAMRFSRQSLAAMLSCEPQELFFTSGGTEGNALALWQAAGRHVVLSAVEHASVLESAKAFGCSVSLARPDENGVVSAEAVERLLRRDTALISVQAANNETGALHPISEIGALAKRRGILFHCDAVQALGQLPLEPVRLPADIMTFSAHKLGGPRGVGAVFVRSGRVPRPLLCGGGQERGLRSGTENTPGICGFRAAVELARADFAERAARVRALREEMETAFLRAGLRVLSKDAPRLPGICALLLPEGLSAERAIAKLDLQGICVSGGAACGMQSGKVSHVYRGMGLRESEAARVIRISLGRHTTGEETARAAQAVLSLLP